MTLASRHVSEAKRIRIAARKMAALPSISARYLQMAREQMVFARFCMDKGR
jgi:hypothetical protein